MWFYSQLLKIDTTAVKLLDNYVLSGVGNFLFIYTKEPDIKLIRKIYVFEDQKIHGIEVNEAKSNILFYGGCYLNLTACDFRVPHFIKLCSQRTDDWVLTAKWLNDQSIAAVVMLNRLIIYDKNLMKQYEVICDAKCILYSAFIHSAEDCLVIFSGTVFGEILIWKVPLNEKVDNCPVLATLKGHKGVIFSVNYNEATGCICSSSDDRSVIVWSIKNHYIHKELQQPFPEINLKFQVYGHQSRIFRSVILDQLLLITGGEDSFINIWDFKGKLIRKHETHQGGPVWALDCNADFIVSGGGDCGVSLFPIHPKLIQDSLELPEHELPKRIGILKSNNLVVISEKGFLYYYICTTKEWLKINHHEDLKSYNLLEVSKCRILVSLSGYHGQIYVYKEENCTLKLFITYEINRKTRIYSFHWLSCDLFFTCEKDGRLTLWTLYRNEIHSITTFILPEGKEIWTTSACQVKKGKFIVGDRKGNLYVYVLQNSKPIQTFKKAHNYLGITKLYNVNNQVISLGRNGIVRTFSISNKELIAISNDKLPFSWIAAMIDQLLLGFSGNNFIVWDYKSRRTLFENNCGGGHRSWDFHKSDNDMKFVCIKEHVLKVLTFKQNDIYPVSVIEGYHTKTINSLRVVEKYGKYFIVSGSEDTHLRLSLTENGCFYTIKNLKSHLSSIRSIYIHKLDQDEDRFLMFSGGGRGQIVCWQLSIDFANFSDCICSEQCSYYEKLDLEMSEMRVMDLKTISLQNYLLLFASTSEGTIKIFEIHEKQGKYQMDFVKKIVNEIKCITKICFIQTESLNILISMSTDGKLTFWDITTILVDNLIVPFKVIKVHQSAINSYSYKIVHNLIIFVTGGDDNSIIMNLFKIDHINETQMELIKLSTFENNAAHCAQITGIFIYDNYFFTTSIDQKLLVFCWEIHEHKIIYKHLCKYNSVIPDIQGMECHIRNGDADIFLYGKGIEYVKYEYVKHR